MKIIFSAGKVIKNRSFRLFSTDKNSLLKKLIMSFMISAEEELSWNSSFRIFQLWFYKKMDYVTVCEKISYKKL